MTEDKACETCWKKRYVRVIDGDRFCLTCARRYLHAVAHPVYVE